MKRVYCLDNYHLNSNSIRTLYLHEHRQFKYQTNEAKTLITIILCVKEQANYYLLLF